MLFIGQSIPYSLCEKTMQALAPRDLELLCTLLLSQIAELNIRWVYGKDSSMQPLLTNATKTLADMEFVGFWKHYTSQKCSCHLTG